MTDAAAAATAPTGAHAVFAALLEARTGQSLGPNRAWRLETVLRPLMRDMGHDSLDALALALLDGRHPALADRAVEALLNGETSFFRDPAIFGLVAEAIAAAPGAGRPRIWCAGCSTGQEPLSLAMLFAERGGESPEIIATDWSDLAIVRGRSGRFNQFEIQRGLSTPRMIRWFEEAPGAGGDWVARPELLRAIQFRRANLMVDAPPAGQFDAILCRNVLLYFAAPARRAVLTRLAGALRPGGVLVLGAGETVIGQSDAFQPSPRLRGLYEPVPRPWAPRAAAG